MLFTVFILLIAAGVASPYIVTVYKRHRILKKLSALARKSGFRVRKLHRFVCFSPNRAPKYDLLFEDKNKAYAVKLWSAVRSDSTLYIRADGTVTERREIPAVMDNDTAKDDSVSTKPRRVPVTRNNFKVRKGKSVETVLLYYPPNKQIILCASNERRQLGSGDSVMGKVICSPARFAKMLTENAQSYSREIIAKNEKN